MPGLYVNEKIVTGDIWCTMWEENNQIYRSSPYYTYETIYFAVKVGWDEK